MQDIYQKSTYESALHKIFLPYKIKMKRVLKIIKQLLRAVPPKKAVHTTNNRIRNNLRNTDERVDFLQNGRHSACSFTGNKSPTGIPHVFINLNDYVKENPSMAASKYTMHNKSENTIYKICAYLQIKPLL